MIDVHTHILPGIDDGCKSESEAFKVLDSLKNLGFSKFVLTPHLDPSSKDDIRLSITEKYVQFRELCRKKDLKYNLAIGSEILLTLELFENKPKEPDFFTLNEKKYQLIETPPFLHPAGFDAYIAYSRKNGLIPILAHIERDRTLVNDTELRVKLKKSGFLFQVDLRSFSKKPPDTIRENALRLLREDSIDLLASDCHSERSIPFIEEGLNFIMKNNSNPAGFFKL